MKTMAQINICEHYRNFFQLPELGFINVENIKYIHVDTTGCPKIKIEPWFWVDIQTS